MHKELPQIQFRRFNPEKIRTHSFSCITSKLNYIEDQIVKIWYNYALPWRPDRQRYLFA